MNAYIKLAMLAAQLVEHAIYYQQRAKNGQNASPSMVANKFNDATLQIAGVRKAMMDDLKLQEPQDWIVYGKDGEFLTYSHNIEAVKVFMEKGYRVTPLFRPVEDG